MIDLKAEHPVIGNLFLSSARNEIQRLMLGTDLQWADYDTPTMQGMARVTGRRIDLLVILSKEQGKGHCRDFISELKRAYHAIGVWEIDNPTLLAALDRWGFTIATESLGDTSAFTGEPLLSTGMRWDYVR